MQRLTLIELTGVPIYEQLQLEEALLRCDTGNWCLINRGSPPAIVMGISGNPELLVDEENYLKNPIPLLRRYSGGGTVVVDHDTLFVSLICNHSITAKPLQYPKEIMDWSCSLYQPIIEGFCLQESDYAIGDRKFGGNAQHLSRGRFAHHSTLLWNYNPELMNLLTLPQKKPAYRGVRTHQDFLCTLSHSLGKSQETFIEELKGELRNQFHLTKVERHECVDLLQLPHRKATQKVQKNRREGTERPSSTCFQQVGSPPKG